MTILNPTMAWFLLLGAVPIIIYLVFRRKKRDVPWGAMYILRRTLEKQSKIKVWKQYLIIALRTLAFMALAIVFMQFLLKRDPSRNNAFPVPPPSTHRLVLIDNSGSMDAAFANGTCMDAALSLCRKILGTGKHPGQTEIITLADAKPIVKSVTDFPMDNEAIETLISQIPLSENSADFERGLRGAIERFRSSPFDHKELYILSDFSKKDFQDIDKYSGIFEKLKKLDVRVFPLKYRNTDSNNFAIISFSPQIDVLLHDQPTLFYLRLGYYGTKKNANTWVTIKDEKNNLLYQDTISLAQGEKKLTIPLRLKGDKKTLTVTLKEDDLAYDNVLKRSFRVKSTLNLVVAQDINMTTGFTNPRTWLEQALFSGASKEKLKEIVGVWGRDTRGKNSPKSNDSNKPFSYKIDFINVTQLNEDLVKNADGVVLLDMDNLLPEITEVLRLYAVRGGTVLFAPGPMVKPGKFNEVFKSFTPATLEKPAKDKIDPEVYENAVLQNADNLIFREIEDSRHGNIGASRFYNYWRIKENPNIKGNKLHFALSNGHPLLIGYQLGRGTVMLWTAGLGMDWNSMVVHPVFPVFFKRLFNIAAARKSFRLNLQPGEPLICELPEETATLFLPNGKKVALVGSKYGKRILARFNDTWKPGMYQIQPDKDNPDFRFNFHVVDDKQESDYRLLTPEQQEQLTKMTGTAPLNTEQELNEAVIRSYPGQSLLPYAASLLFLLLFMETALARRWFP